jgi:hypothetical protein
MDQLIREATEIELHLNNMNSEDSFSEQLGPPLGLSLLAHHLLESSQFPPSPCKGPISILSHSHTIPLSLFYYGPSPSAIGLLPHLSPIPNWSAQVYLDCQLLYNLLSFCAQLIHHPDDGGNMHLWNISQLQRDYTALHPRRLLTSYSPLWEPEISQD